MCRSCGQVELQWMGRCPSCREWDSFDEFREPTADPETLRPKRSAPASVIPIADVPLQNHRRIRTGEDEIDRVLGGGITPGSITLVAGDPGIGKSTLLTALPRLLPNVPILYVCGEESTLQVAARAKRLGLATSKLHLFEGTTVEEIDDAVRRLKPDILIVDSVQTVTVGGHAASAGSVKQLRESTGFLQQLSKLTNTATFLIGHVTKAGDIAGPRILEHIVDTVLYLEGERHGSFRILRAVKNRFGSTNEIGVFSMDASGMLPVRNPSGLFLSERSQSASGSTVVCTIEGTRPLLVEIQALVTRSTYGQPQRNATGFDVKRLQMLIAVLAKRAELELTDHDVFVNVVGGIRLSEPACDLAVAVAIASSFFDIPARGDAVWVGEVGLAGEVRSVSHREKRIVEVQKMGFGTVLGTGDVDDLAGVLMLEVSTLKQAIDESFSVDAKNSASRNNKAVDATVIDP